MPKASTAESSSEMLVVAQAVKATSKNSGRSISTSVVVAASAASGSKRVASTRKAREVAQPESSEKLAPSSKSKEAIQAILDTLEEETMDKSWYDALKQEFTKPYFKKVPLLYFDLALPLTVASLNNFWSKRIPQILSIHQVSTSHFSASHLPQ